jgi:hydrogenase maturation protease
MGERRILVAGIGNIFLGDDAFGVEVAWRLASRPLPPGVEVGDFGIRGFDLAHALLDDLDAAVLVDATPRGGAPGTLYVIEPEADAPGTAASIETHGMHPVRVLHLAHALGGQPPRVLVVGCEPAPLAEGLEEEGWMGLSDAVQAAIEPAVELVEAVLADLLGTAGEAAEECSGEAVA